MSFTKLIEFFLQQLGSFEVWERPLSNRVLAVAVRNKQEIGGPQKLPIVKVPGWRTCGSLCNVTHIVKKLQESITQVEGGVGGKVGI